MLRLFFVRNHVLVFHLTKKVSIKFTLESAHKKCWMLVEQEEGDLFRFYSLNAVLYSLWYGSKYHPQFTNNRKKKSRKRFSFGSTFRAKLEWEKKIFSYFFRFFC